MEQSGIISSKNGIHVLLSASSPKNKWHRSEKDDQPENQRNKKVMNEEAPRDVVSIGNNPITTFRHRNKMQMLTANASKSIQLNQPKVCGGVNACV
jgi:hypothetical protein